MRISKLLTPLALTALFAACSSDDVSTDNDIVVDSSKTEIKLGVSNRGSSTRGAGPIESLSVGTVKGFGMFMLATHVTGTNPPPDTHPINIKWNDPTARKWAVWWDNFKADAVPGADGTSIEVQWNDLGDASLKERNWYPVGNWYSYRFYGYYPYCNNVTRDEKRITVHFGADELDGSTDLIYGRSKGYDASDVHNKYRFNARYFREKDNLGFEPELPSVSFEHLLMRLQFSVVAEPDPHKTGDQYESARTMMVKSVELQSVPASADLIVADFDSDANPENTPSAVGQPLYPYGSDLAGKITFHWNEGDPTHNLALRGTDGNALNPSDAAVADAIDNPTGTISSGDYAGMGYLDIGQPIMLPVPEDPQFQFTVKVVLVKDYGTADEQEFVSEWPMVLDNSVPFKSGYSYRVMMHVAGPREVTLKATLTPWNTDDEGDAIKELIFN